MKKNSTNIAVVSNKDDQNEIDQWFTTDFVHDDDFCDFLHDDEYDLSTVRSGVTTGTTTGTNSMVSSASNSRANSRRGSFVYHGVSMPCAATLGHRKTETTSQSPRKRPRTPPSRGSRSTSQQHEINESMFNTLSFSSSIASVLLNNSAIIMPDQDAMDTKLSKLPCVFTRFLNSGDIDGLRNFIAHHFTEDCLLRTPVMATAIRGRQHIFEAYENTLMCMPDIVCVLKGAHVERETSATGKSVRSIHFKYAFSGVNMDPSESSPNIVRGNISKLLDTTNLNEKQIKDMRSLSRKVKSTGCPYTVLGRATMKWVLNDTDDMIIEDHMNWRFSSILPVDLRSYLTPNERQNDVTIDPSRLGAFPPGGLHFGMSMSNGVIPSMAGIGSGAEVFTSARSSASSGATSSRVAYSSSSSSSNESSMHSYGGSAPFVGDFRTDGMQFPKGSHEMGSKNIPVMMMPNAMMMMPPHMMHPSMMPQHIMHPSMMHPSMMMGMPPTMMMPSVMMIPPNMMNIPPPSHGFYSDTPSTSTNSTISQGVGGGGGGAIGRQGSTSSKDVSMSDKERQAYAKMALESDN